MQARLFMAIMYSGFEVYSKVIEILVKKHGPIEFKGNEYKFDFTNYYEKEMGKYLRKRFVLFKEQIDQEKLPDIKLGVINLEKRFSKNWKRTINIDPGYITQDKVVVASTKNLPHRFDIGRGIFGDIQLEFKDNKKVISKHTFADYRQNTDFFLEVRKTLTNNSQK